MKCKLGSGDFGDPLLVRAKHSKNVLNSFAKM